MDCHRGSGHVANVVGFQSGNLGNNANENWGLVSVDEANCGAEDGMCDKEMSIHTNLISNYDGSSFQLEVESGPQNKRAKNYHSEDLSTCCHKKATATVLHKTKLCYQFLAGSCPFGENCDFAHGMEELRELPHNWQEIVAAHKDELMTLERPREVFKIPVMGLNEETQGPNMRHQCKGFISGAGCQYGETCRFIHSDNNERKSAAICLLPGSGGGWERSGSKSNPGTGGGYEGNVNKVTSNTSNLKTRTCNKWESTGFCNYGRRCIFAHGYAELQHYAGRPVNKEAVDSTTFVLPAKASVGAVGAPVPVSLVPYSYHVGVPSRRLPDEMPNKRWKGPDKISKIYGDWIDDLE